MKKLLLIVVSFSSLVLLGCSFNGVNKSDIVGNDRDEHGCIGSAGYSWCEELKECIRPWETECKSLSEENENITDNGNVESEGVDVDLETKNIDMIYSILELVNSDLDADFSDIVPSKFEWHTEDDIYNIDSYQISVKKTIETDLNDVEKCFLNHGWKPNLMNMADGTMESVEGFEKDNIVCRVWWKVSDDSDIENDGKKLADISIDCGVFENN